MKLIVAAALLACVVLAQADGNIFQKTWDNIQKVEDDVVHKTFPKLLGYGKAGVTAVRHLAIELTEEMLGVFKTEYQMAKKTVSHVIHSDLFDELVNALIPLIDAQATIQTCENVCDQAGKQTTDRLSESIADAACPALCKGALTKLRHAAESLEDQLEKDD